MNLEIVLNKNFDQCCGQELVVLCGYYTCTNCGGINEKLLVTGLTREEELEWYQYRYTRLTHFKKNLRVLQAVDRHPLPASVINKIKKFPFKTIIELKSVMKKEKLSKFNKSIYRIWNAIKGTRLIMISDRLTQSIINIFNKIDRVYNRCKNKRINMLNYNYLTYKILEYLGHINIARNINIIKNKEKLMNLDCHWAIICKEIDIKYIPT